MPETSRQWCRPKAGRGLARLRAIGCFCFVPLSLAAAQSMAVPMCDARSRFSDCRQEPPKLTLGVEKETSSLSLRPVYRASLSLGPMPVRAAAVKEAVAKPPVADAPDANTVAAAMPAATTASASGTAPAASTNTPDPVPSGSSLEPGIGSEACVSVRINGKTVADFATVYRDGERRYLVKREVLIAARIPLFQSAAVMVNGEEYFVLDGRNGIRFHFDPAQQSLAVDVDPAEFQRSIIDASFRPSYGVYQSSTGVLLNHELEMDVVGGSRTLSAILEPRMFNDLGIVTSQFAVTNSGIAGAVRRLGTSFTREMPDRMTTLYVGDSVTRSDSWGRAVNFAGVRWSRNFGTRPDFIPTLLPGLEGQAAEPSTIDLYADNARLMQRHIDPGPFSVTNIPVATGSGGLRLVVTDIFGRQQMISANYLSSPDLLRRGVSDFDYSAGVLRWGLGTATDGYHTMFAAGSHRYGLTSSLTLSARGEVVGSTQTFGGGAEFKAFPIGIASLGVAGSRNRVAGMGGLTYAQLQFQSRTWGYSAAVQSAMKSFRQLGFSDKNAGERMRMSGSLTRNLDGIVSLSLGYMKTSRYDSSLVSSFSGTTGSVSFRLGRLGFLNVTTLYAPSLPQRLSANLTWSLPIGRRRNVMASSQVSSQGASGFTEVGQYMPPGNGFGYRVRTGLDQQDIDAGVDYQNQYGTYAAEMSRSTAGSDYRLREQSAILVMGRDIVSTRWQHSSFALVDVSGNKGVPVLSNNQEIMKTDRRGLAVVPLVPYDRNVIRLDDAGLPVELSMDLAERAVVPKSQIGILVHFAAATNQGFVAVLQQSDGKPVPLGSEVRVDGSAESYIAGYNGEVYFPDVSLPAEVRAYWNGGSCSALVPKKVSNEALPHIGPIVCEKGR
jgi:outer membrane usher protein